MQSLSSSYTSTSPTHDTTEARLVKTLVESSMRSGHSEYTTDAAGIAVLNDTVIRMAELAACLGFRGGAIEEMVAYLVRGVTSFEAAVAFYTALPPALADHPSSRATRQKARPYLIQAIESLNGRDDDRRQRMVQLRQGRDALARCLGPVSSYFTPEVGGRPEYTHTWFKKYTLPTLRGDIKQLSYAVLRYLLASEELKVETEDEVYLLAACWAAQGHEANTSSFHGVMEQIRWQHLSLDFLANVVAHCPLLRKSGGPSLPTLLTASLIHRRTPPAILASSDVPAAARDRGKGTPSWTLRTGIQAEEIEALATVGASLNKIIGKVGGYPLELSVQHKKDEESGEESLGLFFSVPFPYSTSIGTASPPTSCCAIPRSAAWGSRSE